MFIFLSVSRLLEFVMWLDETKIDLLGHSQQFRYSGKKSIHFDYRKKEEN